MLCASVGAALAVLAGAALPGAAGAATAAATAPAAVAAVKLSAGPLGVDVAPWDPDYSVPRALDAVQPLLKAAGIDQIHYGGGVTADEYDWQNDTDISNCPNTRIRRSSAAACVHNGRARLRRASPRTRGRSARRAFVTVNYGTGTPAMAAAWVKQADDHARPGRRRLGDRQRELRLLGAQHELADAPEDYAGADGGRSARPAR